MDKKFNIEKICCSISLECQSVKHVEFRYQMLSYIIGNKLLFITYEDYKGGKLTFIDGESTKIYRKDPIMFD